MTTDAHWATVIVNSPLTIRPDGSTVTVPALLVGTAPIATERVAYVRLGTQLLVIGKPVAV